MWLSMFVHMGGGTRMPVVFALIMCAVLGVDAAASAPASATAVSAVVMSASEDGSQAAQTDGSEATTPADESTSGGDAAAAVDGGAPDDQQSTDEGPGAVGADTVPSTDSDEAVDPSEDTSAAAEEVPSDTAGDQEGDALERSDASLLSLAAPTTSAPTGTGPLPAVTSAWTPEGAQTSGTTRTFTISYTNEGAEAIVNGRIWHQMMARVQNTTVYTVSCTATGGAACPAADSQGMPTGSESVSAADHEYFTTFWAVVTIPAGASLTFTITATTTVGAGVCADSTTPMLGGWAHFSRTGFTMPDDIDASASSVGSISGVSACPDGVVVMTNTVTSPGPANSPVRVLSTDPRVFTATWHNSGSASVTLPISYSYYVPYTGQVTDASWTCASTGGSCPALDQTSPRTISHDNAGEDADIVFSADAVTLAAGQTLTYTITLATTINTCTQDGYLRVQTYANRGAATGETTSFRTQAPSQLVEIGCSTWLVSEGFDGTSVSDTAWKGLNEACLTRATGAATTGNVLGSCTNRTRVPSTTFNAGTSGLPSGYLKLTDDSTSKVGGVLYDRALPSKNGLVLEFTQYQYGDGTSLYGHADGIGFFLSDGSYSLTATGQSGGALGYGYMVESGSSNGLAHAYLGVGFDVFGNFASTSYVGASCTTAQNNGVTQGRIPNAISLRGPGNAKSGYCLVKTAKVTDVSAGSQMYHTSPSSMTTDVQMQTALSGAKRKTRITVYPLKTGETAPLVTVEVDFGSGYVTAVSERMTTAVPELIKFGFSASTGGGRDAHLVSGVRVGTVLPMENLELVKSVDRRDGTGTTKTTFNVGDTIPYQFVVTNTSAATVYQLAVSDPKIATITCPATQIPAGTSVTCTGSYTVTEDDRSRGHFLNTATAHAATSPTGDRNLADTDDEDVVINPTASDALRVIQPGGTASFQVVTNGSDFGLVLPDDPSKITIALIDPTTGLPTGATSITVSGQGTWTLDTATNKVTFTPVNATYSGTVTPLQYRATNAYGGYDDGALSVTITNAPVGVCTATQQRNSDRYWSFGTNAQLDFGTSGTTVTTGSLTSTSTQGSFTVTDSTGALQFVVGSDGTVRNRNGAAMAGGASLGTLTGASPVTVFPAGQGTGKYIIVATTATSTAAGQLRYWTVDMNQNGGLGQVTGGPVSLGAAGTASTAVTSVPNASGTGYWVLSPDKVGNTIRAYPYTFQTGALGTAVSTAVGTAAVSNGTPTSYEDIRFSADFSLVATVASNASASSNDTRTRVRLMLFNGTTGVFSASATTYQQTAGAANRLGYSIEFSPNNSKVYVSSIAVSGNTYAVQRATVTTGTLSAFSNVTTGQSTGGAVRVGADGRLYWASTGSSHVRVLAAPDGTGTTWTTLSLASSTTAGLGLTQTLADCAIAPAQFDLLKKNAAGALLAGAAFAIYADDGGSPGSTALDPGVQETATTGTFIATGLAPGKYWLRETRAPSGYALLAEDILLEVQASGVINVVTVGNPQVSLSTSAGRYVLTITDDASIALPLAGGGGTAAYVVAGGVIVLAALLLAWWWRRRRRGDRHASRTP